MLLTADFNGTTVNYKSLSPLPPLYFVRHDWEIRFGDRSPRNAPEVHFLDHYSKLTKEWQFFWRGLNNTGDKAYCDTQFAKYTADDAFITDGKGSKYLADYVNGTNLDKAPMEIKCLFCGGNVITGIEYTDANGRKWLKPTYLDASKAPPMGMTYQTHPWFIHQATIISGDLPDDTRIINPFVNFGGRNTGIPVYYPFMGYPWKETRYPLEWLKRVDSVPNPYHPEMSK